MGDKLEFVLTVAERIASSVKIVVPAIRDIASLWDSKPEVIMISNDEQ